MSSDEAVLRNVTDISPFIRSNISVMVSSDPDYSLNCSCIFGQCTYCENILRVYGVPFDVDSSCLVCESYCPKTTLDKALEGATSFDVVDIHPEQLLTWNRLVTLLVMGRSASLLEDPDFPFEQVPDIRAFKSWSTSDLLAELKRPSRVERDYVQAVFCAILGRRQDSQFVKFAIAQYKLAVAKVQGQTNRLKRSSGSRRAQFRRKGDYFVPREVPRRIQRQEEVHDVSMSRPVPTISDLLPRSGPIDCLKIGELVVSSRDEFSRLSAPFARNKGLFMEILGSSLPLSSFQARIFQKFQSDGNFRHKIESFLSKEHSTFQMWGVVSTSDKQELEGEDESDDGDSSCRSFADFRDYVPRNVLRGMPRRAAGVVSDALRRVECEARCAYEDLADDDVFRQAAAYETIIRTVNGMARVAVTVDLILKANTRFQKLEILFLYLSAFDVPYYLQSATDYFASGVAVFQGSAMDDFLSDAFSFVGISHVLSQLMGAPLSGMDFLRERLRNLSRMKDGDVPLRSFWAALKRFVLALGQCFSQKSLDPLFAVGETPEEILFEAEALMTYRDNITGLTHSDHDDTMDRLRTLKKIPSYWTRTFLGTEYVEKAQELIKKLDVLLPIVASESRALYLSARSKLFTFVSSNVNALAVNGQRLQPLGVALVGPPGVGKTNFTKLLYRYLGTARGFSTDASGIYNWKSDVNFQDGLNPGHWVIVGDDLDLGEKPCTAGVANHVDAIMNIVDNKPFPVESAAVDLKGTNFARPLLYLHCTNNTDYRLTGFTRQSEAIFRRLPIKLEFAVLPGFTKGAAVDSMKVMGCVDIHSIRVMEFDFAKRSYELYKVMGTTECLRYLRVRFDDNLRQQQGLAAANSIPLCLKCSIPVNSGLSLCTECSAIRLQGQGPSAMASATKALENFNEISDHVKRTDLINRVDRLTVDVSEAIKPTLAVNRAVVGFTGSLHDFIVKNGAYCAVAAGLAAMVALYLSKEEYQGRINNSTQTAPSNFVRVSDVKPLGAAFKQVTFTPDELRHRVRANIAKILCYDSAKPAYAHALRVGLDSFLANGHMLGGVKMELQFRGLSYAFTPCESNVIQIGTKDLVLIRIPGVPAAPTCLPMFWVDVDLSYSTFDSVSLLGPDFEIFAGRNLIMSEQMQQYSGLTLESDCDTSEGHCGLPMLAQVGSALRIVGLHHSHATHVRGFKMLSSARAPLICRTEIELAAVSISASLQSGAILQSCFPKGLKQQDLNDPMCSELALALERGAPVVNLGHDGNASQYSASKSKCVNSPFYERVEPYCRELTGRPHYWQVPHMKGKMIDDQWHSGFQNVFKFYRNPDCYGDFYAPILDFVEPLRSLDTTGYAMLSLDEAILGVESSVINPLNFQTSIGPPLTGPKSRHVTQTGHISPELRAQIEEINQMLTEGQIPIGLASCTLKDEPVKASKNEVRDIRVFNNINGGLNIVKKQYFGPIQSFMRANAMCLESMVGIDMSRDGGQRIMERARIVDPSLNNVVEGDFEKMDKTIAGCMAWAIVEVYKEIASILGLDVEKVALLAWADFHIIYSIQGDLFQVGGINPSGSQTTVENNAIANSLAQRVAWFRYHNYRISVHDYVRRVQLALCFRTSMVLITYGDDFLLFMRQRLDLVRYFSYFLLIGMRVTDARKLEQPIYRSFWEVDFLKRRFRLVDGYVRAGLDMKSIFRMLMIARPTTLSRKEQSAIVLEEALREIFLNVDPNFELWRGRFRQWADEMSLWDSKYLQLETAAYYESLWQNKVFSPWVVPSASVEVFEDTNTFQSKMSNSIPTTSAMGDASISSVATSATTNLVQSSPTQLIPTPTTYGSMVAGAAENGDLSHASGNIISLRQPIMAGTTGNQKLVQPMADTKFSDSLQRDVFLHSLTDFTTLTPFAFNPWSDWLSNGFVTNKINNFQFIRGSGVLHGVIQVPPLAAGLVCVTCTPKYQDSTGGATIRPYCITPLHSLVDLSNSTSFQITMPWCVSSNWGNLEDNLWAQSWTVTYQVLSPILTAVPSGCISAQISFFFRPGPDFELSGAKFESGRQGRAGRLPATVTAAKPATSGPSFNVANAKEETLQETVNKASIAAIGMKPSEALLGASGIAAMGAGFPYIGPALGVASGIMGAAGSFAKWLGFTRDAVIETPTDVLPKAANNMVNCDGGDTSQVSSLFSTNKISIDPAISGSFTAVDESSTAYIHSRYTLVGVLDYVVGNQTYQDQFFGVTPCFGTFSPDSTHYYPTTAGYTAGKFVHWRGDLDYIFYPVVSSAHGGSLQVIWQPVPPSGSEPSDLTNISLNTIIDLGPAKPYHIRVGYNNDNPMAYTDFYAMDSSLEETDYTTLNGYLRVRAVTPITGSVCGQTIQVLVFQAAAENMEFGLATEAISIEGVIKNFGVDVDISVDLQSAKIGSGGQDVTSFELVPSTGFYPVADHLMGERVESYRALMQKPSILYSASATTNTTNYERHNFGPFQQGLGYNSTNWFNYFGTVFLGYAGSVREKWLIDLLSGSGYSLKHTPIVQNALAMTQNLPLGQINPSITPFSSAVETTVPYQHNELFIPAYKAGLMEVGTVVNESAYFNLVAARYYSGGPDMRITMFRTPNSFVFGTFNPALIGNLYTWSWNAAVGGAAPALVEPEETKAIAALDVAAPVVQTGNSVQTNPSVDNLWDLTRYRARTGRKQLKTTGRLYKPPVLPAVVATSATQS